MHRPVVDYTWHPYPMLFHEQHEISCPTAMYGVDTERCRIGCCLVSVHHSPPSTVEAHSLGGIAQQPIIPLRRDPDLPQQLTPATLKEYPDRCSALLVGQLPKEAEDETILKVIQIALQRVVSVTPLIYFWDRFKASCGTLWVPQQSADAVIEALDRKVRFDMERGQVYLYPDGFQPEAPSFRRITCARKLNVQPLEAGHGQPSPTAAATTPA
jgi:hypothetical protein